MIVVTTNDLAGYRVVRHLGVVRGITVRSRSVIGNIGGAIQSLFGGNISVYTNLAETARQEAYDLRFWRPPLYQLSYTPTRTRRAAIT